MIHTDGNPTIANGAGDELPSVYDGSVKVVDPVATRTASERIREARDSEVDLLSLGASRALAIFADELEALKADGKTLTYERIIESLREVSAKAARGL